MDVRSADKRRVLLWLVPVMLAALPGRVTVAKTNAGQTAADFLLIGAGARATGMGGAYSAVTDESSAAYWNPAGLAGLENGEILLSHFAWYQDITLEYGAFARPVTDVVGLAASVTYLNYGTIEGYDVDGNATGEISAYDLALALSCGYAVNDRLALGITGKLVTQQLDDIGATTLAADLGANYHLGRLALAGVLSNLGPSLNFQGISERLPSAMRIGVSAYPFEDRLLTAMEIEKRFGGNTVIRQGAELSFADQYFIRSGYNFYPAADSRSFGSGFTVGLGLKLSRVAFDYSYTFEEKYSSEDLHRFALVIRVGS